MQQLAKLPNIGKVNAEKLMKAGVHTPDELYELGSKEAFIRVRLYADEGACLNMLYGLEGAVRGIRWHNLPQEDKNALKQFYQSLSSNEKNI